jgi:hypothetical protein
MKVVLPLCLLAVLTLGCGVCGALSDSPLPSGSESADGTEVVVPADTEEDAGEAEPVSPAEEGEEGDGEEADEADLPSVSMELDVLDSYVAYFKMTMKESENASEESLYEMRVEFVRDPLAESVTVWGDDPSEGMQSIRIGDMQYLSFGEGECIATSASDEDEIAGEMLDPEEVIGGISSAKRVRPDETINGIRCRHYTFDESAFVTQQFARASGEAWIAVDGDYVVKYVAQVEGENPETGEDGYMLVEYEISDINEPLVIEPPADCAALDEADFPLMPDASDVSLMGTMATYATGSGVSDVVVFYQEEMAALGWTEDDGAFVSDEAAMLNFSKDGESLVVSVSVDDSRCIVTIITE